MGIFHTSTCSFTRNHQSSALLGPLPHRVLCLRRSCACVFSPLWRTSRATACRVGLSPVLRPSHECGVTPSAPCVGMNTQPQLLRFQAFSLSLQVVGLLRHVLPAIQKHDASLTKQLRAAASSISLNLAESRGRVGRDRSHFFRIAAGSAEESIACLLVAQAWGYLDDTQCADAIEHLDHLLGIIGKLRR